MRPIEIEEVTNEETKMIFKKCTKALFILKWGGELTHAGIM